MRGERALIALHGAGALLALAAALVWPRPGQAALLVPLGSQRLVDVLGWAERERAPLLALDTASERAIARVADNRSLLRALRSGIVPIAVRAPGCTPQGR